MNTQPTPQNHSSSSQASFAQIVEQWQAMVFNTALSMLQNKEDAEDITQDVFVDVYENMAFFKQDAQLKTWIYRITINKTLDWIKRNNRQKHGGLLKRVFFVSAEEEPTSLYHPGVQLDNKEKAAALFKALQKLPQKQQVVFTLHKVEGLPYSEIADILNSSVSAVEMLMVRAKTGLKKLLETYYTQQNG